MKTENTTLADDIRKIAERWRDLPGSVSGALQTMQQQFGYLPEEGLRLLAEAMDVPLSRLFAVATFYAHYRLNPPGRHHLQVCTGTACHVLGAVNLREKLERELNVACGGTSPDRQFSLDDVRCLGCCSLGPVVRIDAETYGRVRPKNIRRLLKPYRKSGASRENQK